MAGAVKPPGLAFGTDDADEDDDPVDLVKGKIFVSVLSVSQLEVAAATRKVAPLVASKKVSPQCFPENSIAHVVIQIANNINKWNQVQEELSHKLDTPEVSAPTLVLRYLLSSEVF